MGYRSDVRIVVSKKGYKELKKFVEKFLEKYEKEHNIEGVYNIFNHKDIETKRENYYYLGWNDIKWYDGIGGYEDINAIVKGLDYLAENDFSYRFARIGENYDDIEERSFDSEEEEYLEYPCIVRQFDDGII